MTLICGQPVAVHDPEVELRDGVTLFGGQAIPAHCLSLVFEDAFAIGVHDPEVVLRPGVTLFGGLPDRVEIVLCRERHDGEATRHEHGSSYTDQLRYFIYRLQM